MSTRQLASTVDERWHALTGDAVLARVSSARRGLSAGEAARRLVAAILLAVALLRGFPVGDAVLAAITLAVAAIPEGLPAIVTIALAVGVQRMARRRAVVRELPAVETLGSTSVICTGKTGTLTRNEMILRRAWTPTGDEAQFEGVGYEAAGRMLLRGDPGPLKDLLTGAALANEAQLDSRGDRRTVLGDPTDGALLVAAERGGMALAELFRDHPRRAVLPFDSERRYMASSPAGARRVTYFKGAPEVLLAHVDPAEAVAARGVLDAYAAEGMRVLALAARYDTDSMVVDDGPLRLLGLVALIDPLRREVVEAVAACHRAGIDVKMITGDHAATAAAIGRELGIAGEGPPMTGAEIAALSEDELRDRVRATGVFARVAPEHKLKLVRAFQAGIAALLALQAAVVHLPPLQTVFHTADLTAGQWILAAAAGAVAVPVVAAEKRWRRGRDASADVEAEPRNDLRSASAGA